jgi:hypothetical protein
VPRFSPHRHRLYPDSRPSSKLRFIRAAHFVHTGLNRSTHDSPSECHQTLMPDQYAGHAEEQIVGHWPVSREQEAAGSMADPKLSLATGRRPSFASRGHLPFQSESGVLPSAFSARVFTGFMGICGFPPFRQRTPKGWGTESLSTLESKML